MVNASPVARVYKNIQLSYRGSERQPPSVSQLALHFSKVMSEHAESGKHDPSWTTTQRLKAAIHGFHQSEGTLSKWQIDDDKEKSITNLLVGSTPAARKVIADHLNYVRWKESAFTSDLLKSTRWMLHATWKSAKEPFKRLLVVDEEIQVAFLENHVAHYSKATRRVKASAKPKCRPTVQEWDSLVSYTAIMVAVKREIVEFFADAANQDDSHKALTQLDACFMARHGRSGKSSI